MYEDTAYGTSQAVGLRNGAKKAGVEIVMDDAYPLGITDVTPLINKLRASGAQAVFPVSYLNDSLQIIRVMRQQGIPIPAIGGAAGYVIPDFEKGLGEYAEGVLSISGLQERVLHTPGAMGRLVDAVTFNASSPFRDPAFFAAFDKRVAPNKVDWSVAEEMLKSRKDSLEGKLCLVSGSGNVSQYTIEKLLEPRPPVDAHTTALAPSSTALEMANVMPRSLNEPVGFRPSYFR